MEQALVDLNARFEWLWTHDLEADVRMVEERTAELLLRGGGRGTAGREEGGVHAW